MESARKKLRIRAVRAPHSTSLPETRPESRRRRPRIRRRKTTGRSRLNRHRRRRPDNLPLQPLTRNSSTCGCPNPCGRSTAASCPARQCASATSQPSVRQTRTPPHSLEFAKTPASAVYRGATRNVKSIHSPGFRNPRLELRSLRFRVYYSAEHSARPSPRTSQVTPPYP